ncbi:uncharacterized protein LOC110026243 [Phalaenopsis equestris]|uniref:uncharacterized protein LOC110026243 n=1 Tax=Phalaenopsis equestris TaxID=78828 RepID=UPI0009E18C89|nr:uncharacterized protein LOC110026243 [Phalaenopsis equestris]
MAWLASVGYLSAVFVDHPCSTATCAFIGGRKSSCFIGVTLSPRRQGSIRRGLVFCMAPEEEKITRRSPLDFPIEWERPKPGRRPDIFPRFSPMKTPLPTPWPADPPEEDEEKEEEERQEEEEEEDDPEKEGPEKPDKAS